MTTLDSTINTAIVALLAKFTTVAAANNPYGPTGSSIQVVDGTPIEYVANYVMSVKGFSNWNQAWFAVGQGFDRLEDYDIDCEIHCWQGDTDPSGRRLEAFTLLGAVRASIYTDLRSGTGVLGLPMAADVAIHTGDAVTGPASGSSGWGIDLNFVCHVENVLLS